MVEQRHRTVGSEIGFVLANMAAMQPMLKKRRMSVEDFNPYSTAKRVSFKTRDVRYLYRAFNVWPDKEKRDGRRK